jgi:hypothetical protein
VRECDGGMVLITAYDTVITERVTVQFFSYLLI